MPLISFARGFPGPDLLPVDEFGDCAREALARDGATALNYGQPGGYGPLREWIAARHGVEAGRVIVTNGSLQAFNFVARHFVAAGVRFFVEAPCYDRSLSILRRLGADVDEIPLCDEGLDVEALERALAETRGRALVYTIPTFQNPSGRTLSRESRGRLLALARESGAIVFEDDPYGLLRFSGEPLPRVFELAGGEGVLFLSSFSKTVAPGIRVGYLVISEELVPAIEGFVLENYVSPSIFVQATLYEFLRRERFDSNVERIRAGLRVRRDAMLAALEREMPDGTSWNEPEGGYFLWVDLPGGVRGAELHGQAADAGVAFVKGSDFYFTGGGEESIRLAFSYATADEIDEGVARLGRLVREATAVAA
ncbi:MAG TPA: PLP-dependent aminotransferase family protein [Gaiellaceae bacterium]|nr:PLP-dependent aminotransferase family protein [Gaiellaceae bacterium]